MSVSEINAIFDRLRIDQEMRDSAEAAERGITVEQLHAEREAAEVAKKTEEATRREQSKRRQVMEEYGARVPAETADAFVKASLRPTKALQATREYLQSSEAFLLLSGGVGAGKTLASLWALSEVSGLLVRSPDLGPALDPWKGDPDRIETFRPSWPRLVVLDDLGVERTEDARWGSCFDELIDCRQGKIGGFQLRTIISTNLTPEQIKARYSERARSRIRASCRTVLLPTEDMRGKR